MARAGNAIEGAHTEREIVSVYLTATVSTEPSTNCRAQLPRSPPNLLALRLPSRRTQGQSRSELRRFRLPTRSPLRPTISPRCYVGSPLRGHHGKCLRLPTSTITKRLPAPGNSSTCTVILSQRGPCYATRPRSCFVTSETSAKLRSRTRPRFRKLRMLSMPLSAGTAGSIVHAPPCFYASLNRN